MLITESDVLKYINNWVKFGKFSETNKVAFFAFNKNELETLLRTTDNASGNRLYGGIRFHLAKQSNVYDANDFLLIATGVKANSIGQYEDDFSNSIVSIRSNSDANYDKQAAVGEFPIIAAQEWTQKHTLLPFINNNKYLAKDANQQYCKLWSVVFDNNGDILLNYLSQTASSPSDPQPNFVLIHFAMKDDSERGRIVIPPAEKGLTTFILSLSDSDRDDSNIIAVRNTNNVLEWGSACPPDCGQCC
jgi:hypothetical protein